MSDALINHYEQATGGVQAAMHLLDSSKEAGPGAFPAAQATATIALTHAVLALVQAIRARG